MKLYTQRQFIKTILVVSIIMASLCLGTFLGMHFSYTKTNKSSLKSSNDISLSQTAPTSTNVATSIQNYTQDERQNIDVYKKCSDAVVNISTKVVGYNWFLEAIPQDGGTGSGSIIDKRGYVVTNRHVIEGAYKIYISLSDGTQLEGKLIGEDPQTDIAVLKFSPPKNIALTTIPFGDSSNLLVGQKMLAIGNPFGFDRTLTTGIISSLGRPIQNSQKVIIQNMIQTDTSINPGNSGGPLLDTEGKMVGINTMIYSTSGSSAGVGFAVPINTAKRVVSDLISFGKVKRGIIDQKLSVVPMNASIANYIKSKTEQGLLVSEISKNGNAQKAGLKAGTEAVRYGSVRSNTIFYIGGDIITSIDNHPIASLAMLNSFLEEKKPGDTVSIGIIRNKTALEIDISLIEE